MLLRDTRSDALPLAAVIDTAEGKKRVRLTDNVRSETVPAEDGGEQTMYVFDEVVFDLPADRTDTDEEIREDFDAWWAYGSQDEEEPMTLEERVEMIEEMLMGGVI